MWTGILGACICAGCCCCIMVCCRIFLCLASCCSCSGCCIGCTEESGRASDISVRSITSGLFGRLLCSSSSSINFHNCKENIIVHIILDFIYHAQKDWYVKAKHNWPRSSSSPLHSAQASSPQSSSVFSLLPPLPSIPFLSPLMSMRPSKIRMRKGIRNPHSSTML